MGIAGRFLEGIFGVWDLRFGMKDMIDGWMDGRIGIVITYGER
jgi:hypothetical protein